MGRVIYIESEYRIIKISANSFIVVNTKGHQGMHAHMAKRSTCQKLIKLVRSKQVPDSDYLKGSALRISTDIKYKQHIMAAINKGDGSDGVKGIHCI